MPYYKGLDQPNRLPDKADELRQVVLEYITTLYAHPVSKYDEDKMKHARSLHNAMERVTADYP